MKIGSLQTINSLLNLIYTCEVRGDGEGDGDLRHLRASENQREVEKEREEKGNIPFFFLHRFLHHFLLHSLMCLRSPSPSLSLLTSLV